MALHVLRGDARALPLPDESVDLVVTSPPYWGQRDYGFDQQIGLEAGGPAEYLDNLLDATVEWVRVLKPSGSLFVVLGDKASDRAGPSWRGSSDGNLSRPSKPRRGSSTSMAPRKSVLLLPQRYAIALVDKLGLFVRMDGVWDKPSAIPESVTDRVRRTHEYILHVVKRPRYYSALDRIREPHAAVSVARTAPHRAPSGEMHPTFPGDRAKRMDMTKACHPLGALPPSVWRIPTDPLDVPEDLGTDHYAAFPAEIPRRLVLGFSPERVCLACGEGLRPLVERDPLGDWNGDEGKDPEEGRRRNGAERNRRWRAYVKEGRGARIVGERCRCGEPAETVPGVVLDPMGGTGTTAQVAHALGRVGVSVDGSPDYCRIARDERIVRRRAAKALEVKHVPAPPPDQGALW